MGTSFVIYGATGFVGEAAARHAVAMGLRPVLCGRNASKLSAMAAELDVEARAFSLDDPRAIDAALADAALVLHCAGPFLHTSRQMVDACLRTGTHYLDISGELPVYESIAARDAEARARGVMLLPGAGFDVVPTDCLAAHLKRRLPTATHLTIAFQSDGPGGLPPGTQRTAIELLPYGTRVRRNGRLEKQDGPMKTRVVDFGKGPVTVTQLQWGDVFTAFHSTGIPNIEDYTVLPRRVRKQLALMQRIRPLTRLSFVRKLLQRSVRPGPTAQQRALTVTHVWGEVTDAVGGRAVGRLHGPEAGVEWTVRCALAIVQRVLAGQSMAGYQTPAMVYGPDFVMEMEGVSREDL